MTTIDASNSPEKSPRSSLTLVLEVAMVVVGLAIGAAFYSSIWIEPAQQNLQAALASSSPSRS
jgi:hypothetical protein